MNKPFVPRRGRPSKQQIQAIDRAIIDTATRLFLESGNFDEVTMDAVAFVAGVSKGTLYSRYVAKEDLLEAVVKDLIEEWSRHPLVTEDLPPSGVGTRLRVHARNLALNMARSEVQALGRVVASTGGRFPHLIQTLHEYGAQKVIDRIAAEISSTPGNAYRNPVVVASVITHAIIGWQNTQDNGPEASLKLLINFADQVVDTVVDGEGAW